jgi:hypothetical protein
MSPQASARLPTVTGGSIPRKKGECGLLVARGRGAGGDQAVDGATAGVICLGREHRYLRWGRWDRRRAAPAGPAPERHYRPAVGRRGRCLPVSCLARRRAGTAPDHRGDGRRPLLFRGGESFGRNAVTEPGCNVTEIRSVGTQASPRRGGTPRRRTRRRDARPRSSPVVRSGFGRSGVADGGDPPPAEAAAGPPMMVTGRYAGEYLRCIVRAVTFGRRAHTIRATGCRALRRP